jgi:hypothetical protein
VQTHVQAGRASSQLPAPPQCGVDDENLIPSVKSNCDTMKAQLITVLSALKKYLQKMTTISSFCHIKSCGVTTVCLNE